MLWKAFILDLDGVITDTAMFHYQAWRQLAEEENIPFDRTVNEKLRGVSRRQSLEILLGDHIHRYSAAQFQEMMDRKNTYYRHLLRSLTDQDYLPGARRLLDQLHQLDLKIAIGSASKNTQTVLKSLGIAQEFDAIADGHSVKHSKPAPDIFLCAAKKLSISPRHCVVVEDASSGIEAALAAGMFAVGVGPAERVGKAHLRYENTEKINLQEILKTGWDPSSVQTLASSSS